MKTAIAGIVAASAVLAANAALANGHSAEQCFDKGTLTYFDCPTAEVAPEDRFYIGARGGAAWVEDVDSFFEGETFEVDFDTGYVVSAMLGYDAAYRSGGVSLRPELEVGYLAADIDQVVQDGTVEPVAGDVSVLFGFVNLFADIPVATDLDLILGGGVGVGAVDAQFANQVDDEDTVFGYNLGAGLGLALTDDVELEALYRYMSFSGGEFTDTDGDTVEADIDAHTATVGVRFKF